MALLTDNLIAYWKFDTDASPQPDSVGNFDLTVSGATFDASGKLGGKISLTTNDYLYYTGVITTGFKAVSFWFYNDETITSGASNEIPIHYDTNNIARYIALGQVTSDFSNEILTFWNSDGSSWYWTFADFSAFTTNIPIGWHHYVLTWVTASGSYRLYIDGEDGGLAREWSTPAEITTWDDTHFGRRATLYIEGDYDEIGIWERDLTPAEAALLYNGGAGLSHPFPNPPKITNIQSIQGIQSIQS